MHLTSKDYIDGLMDQMVQWLNDRKRMFDSEWPVTFTAKSINELGAYRNIINVICTDRDNDPFIINCILTPHTTADDLKSYQKIITDNVDHHNLRKQRTIPDPISRWYPNAIWSNDPPLNGIENELMNLITSPAVSPPRMASPPPLKNPPIRKRKTVKAEQFLGFETPMTLKQQTRRVKTNKNKLDKWLQEFNFAVPYEVNYAIETHDELPQCRIIVHQLIGRTTFQNELLITPDTTTLDINRFKDEIQLVRTQNAPKQTPRILRRKPRK